MRDKIEKTRLAILRILQDANRPLGSTRIGERLAAMGLEVSERTIRFYLLALDRAGLTRNLGKRGRQITEPGVEELSKARVIEKVGLLASKIDQMTYRMDFNLSRRTGTIVLNLCVVPRPQLQQAGRLIRRVFAAGYGMGELMTLVPGGERVGEVTVPKGMVGIGTVCSITLNGVLLAEGIPTVSRFGGLLELVDGKPFRFEEIIYYEGTSLDPLEIFIRGGMTDTIGAAATGNGRIGASFREVPGASRDQVIALTRKLEKAGLGGVLMVGWPGRPLLEIPVGEGRMGVIVTGGLNPLAALEEKGVHIHARALAALVDYRELFPYPELEARIRKLA